MRKSMLAILFLGLVSIATGLVRLSPALQSISPQRTAGPTAASARSVEAYGKLPLSFEANQGQTDSQVKFQCQRSVHFRLRVSPQVVQVSR
jgi:hypothetical protein